MRLGIVLLALCLAQSAQANDQNCAAPSDSGRPSATCDSPPKSLEEMGAEIRRKQKEREDNPQLARRKVEQAIAAYLQCANTASRKIDDRVSDASTVALGVRSYCAEYLEALGNESSTRPREWADTLHPRVVEITLMNRAPKRREKRS